MVSIELRVNLRGARPRSRNILSKSPRKIPEKSQKNPRKIPKKSRHENTSFSRRIRYFEALKRGLKRHQNDHFGTPISSTKMNVSRGESGVFLTGFFRDFLRDS
jgi:hypothetical protein